MTNASRTPVHDALRRRLVVAPMAGGPTTPELVAAAAEVGALGMLAAGYLTPDALAAQIDEVRARTSAPFGVNLFVPDDDDRDADPRVAALRDRLADRAGDLGVQPLPEPRRSDDSWGAKLDVVEAARVPVVSFTFGLPDEATVQRLHAAGAELVGTVTTVDEAREAEARGLDALVVQGPEAGGHRGTLRTGTKPGTAPVESLIALIHDETPLPLVAAGGLMTAASVQRVLELGAVAAQVGTALLLADEAGTNPVHRAALVDPRFSKSIVTRAFTGRAARGLANAFTDAFDDDAPDRFPDVHEITSPIRRAAVAAGDPEWTHLWAGTGWRNASAGPAAQLLEELDPQH